MKPTQDKIKILKKRVKGMGSVVVAFSGGVDSTFLAKIAHDVLKDKAVAVTAISPTIPKKEVKSAKKTAKRIGIRHAAIQSEEMKNDDFRKNSRNRCYHCKTELYTKLNDFAKKNKIEYVLDGANHDDANDFRPGARAVRELRVISPLQEVGLTKEEIRKASKELGLETWNKPSLACLSSRFPYGTEITSGRLSRVEKAEEFLKKMGIIQLRVRFHNDIARIEVSRKDMGKVLENADDINQEFKKLGFNYTALDIKGYRTGSMNEVLK